MVEDEKNGDVGFFWICSLDGGRIEEPSTRLVFCEISFKSETYMKILENLVIGNAEAFVSNRLLLRRETECGGQTRTVLKNYEAVLLQLLL